MVLGVGGGITEEEDELEERAENRTHDAAAKEAGATERERHERGAPGRWVPEQCGEELVAEDEGAPCEEDPDCDKALECHCHGGIPLPRSHDGEARARSNVRSASMWCADDGPVEGRWRRGVWCGGTLVAACPCASSCRRGVSCHGGGGGVWDCGVTTERALALATLELRKCSSGAGGVQLTWAVGSQR